MSKNKVFLDTSILITALLSSRGGSFYILTQFRDRFYFQINNYVLEEVMEVLKKKFLSREELKSNLFLLLGLAKVKVLSNPTKSSLGSLDKIINQKDAPILCSALQDSDYLLTLDKDFLNKKIQDFAKENNLLIFTPRQFIESFLG